MNSPARDSRRSARPWDCPHSPLIGASQGVPFRAVLVCYQPVSGAFHPPLGVLFTFGSRYWSTIGLGTYLALEASGPQLPAPYPRCGTLGPEHRPSSLRLRGYHPLWPPIPGEFGSAFRAGLRPITPHSPRVNPGGFGLGCSPFGRPYSGNLVLISFPPPTWMLPFGGFPIPGSRPGNEVAEATPGNPIRRSPDQRPPAATRGLSQLATSFVGAQAEASTGWRTPA